MEVASKTAQRLVQEKNSEIEKYYKKIDILDKMQLNLDTAFGINSNPICNQLQVVGQKYVIFMIGNIVVVKDLIDKTQKFYSFPNRFNNVTALYGISKEQKWKEKSKKVDKNGKPIYLPNTVPVKIYLAESSESQDKYANLAYIKPYKNKFKMLNIGVKGNIKEMTVDRSKRMIACLLQSVQSLCVLMFNYRKEKMLACTQLKVSSIENISIHPVRQKSMILMGKNYLRMWELQAQEQVLKEQQQLVPLKTQKQSRFYDMSWQSNNKNPILFVLTNHNNILLIQNDNLIHTLNLPEIDELFSIRATRKGFCIGGNNRTLLIYQLDKSYTPNLILGGSKSNDKNSNNMLKEGGIREDSEDKIIRIHCSSNDGIITVATTNQIGSLNFFYLNTLRIDADISSLDQFFPSGFHNKKINCLSRSVTKQLFASCSEDNTVKIWNFFDAEGYEKKGLICHKFNQEPLSVSMHPSGLFLAVSFATAFKVFAIVNNTLEVLKEIQIPNCKIIKYSHGGHFLAVNQKEHIFIYDSIYYETLHLFSLSNHVQDITITKDDTQIVATCTNGYVYCFNLYESLHSKDYQNKKGYQHKQTTTYTCIGYDNKILQYDPKTQKSTEGNLFVGCTTEKYMVLYKNKCKQLIAEFPISDCHITSLLICPIQGLLITGTSKGTLRVYNWPLTQNALKFQLVDLNSNGVSTSTNTLSTNNARKVRIKEPEYVEINAHSYSVVAMTCSHDENYLFTGSEDGTILCFSLSTPHEKQRKQIYCLIKPQDRKRIAQSANDLYLQKMDRIEQKNETIKKLKFEILRSQKKLKLEKEKLQIIYRQKMDNLKKQYKITLETNKKIKQSYISNATKQFNELNEKFQVEKKRYEEEIDKLKHSHKEKIQYEMKRNQNLRRQIQELQRKHTNQLKVMQEQHKLRMKKTKFDFYEKCHKLQIKYSNFLNQSKMNSDEFKNKLEQKEKQYENQIEAQIKNKKEEIAKVKTINHDLEQRNKKLEEEFKRLKEEDEKQQEHFEKLFKQHNDIRFENLKSDEDILKMQHQLLQRLQVIESKEQTCKNARYEQTTLQNFRYMLDSKIQSLEQKKMEMIEKIKSRESDLKNMFNELIKESEQNEKKAFQLKQLNVQIQVLENQIKSAEEEIDKNQSKFKYFKTQVSSIANSSEDVRTIGKRLKKLVDECEDPTKEITVGDNNNNEKSESLKEVNEELTRQANWMEKKLKMVKDIAENYKEMREQNINNVLAQNTDLIDECNKLRTRNQDYKRNIKQYEKELADLLRKKERNSQMKRQQQALNLKGINKKLKQNQVKITDQHQKLQNMNQQIKQMLRNKSERKLPSMKSKPK